MKVDRFRPDAAARRVIPLNLGLAPGEGLLGKTYGSVVVDDPEEPPSEAKRAAARALFEDRGPLAGVGRNSIPKSHRGEGVNFVD